MITDNVKYTNLSASGQVDANAGAFYGFSVNSHTSGTLKLWDNTAGSGAVLLDTITFAAGPTTMILPMGISYNTGLFATIGGTANITFFWI